MGPCPSVIPGLPVPARWQAATSAGHRRWPGTRDPVPLQPRTNRARKSGERRGDGDSHECIRKSETIASGYPLRWPTFFETRQRKWGKKPPTPPHAAPACVPNPLKRRAAYLPRRPSGSPTWMMSAYASQGRAPATQLVPCAGGCLTPDSSVRNPVPLPVAMALPRKTARWDSLWRVACRSRWSEAEGVACA